MAIYTVDVFSGSADSIIQDSHAQGVIVKATQGTGYVNPLCNHQWDLAGLLGKLRGLYHYAGGGDPVAEAQYFLNAIRNYVGQGILAVDWESNQNSAWGNTNWVRGFVDEVHRQTGVWPIIYVQESALNQVANCANDCGLWVAKYASMNWGSWTLPNMTPSSGAFSAITGWQYTGGDMDRSIFYLDAAGWNHLANPGQQTTPPPASNATPPAKPSEPGSSSTAPPEAPPTTPPTGPNVNPIPIPPSADTRYIQGIVLNPGYDTESNVWGYGYSPDNGQHFYVINTVYGRKYRQEDADRLLPFLEGKLSGGGSHALDTSKQTTNDPPSGYPDGFSYEVKQTSAVGIEPSAGSIGIMITAKYDDYARQTFQVLDSGTAATFSRTGSGSSWNSWR